MELLLAFFAHAINNTSSCVLHFVSHSMSPRAEVFEHRGLAVKAPTRLNAVISPLLTFLVCSSQRYLCLLADSAEIEVFEILAADWRQTRAASPLSEKRQNFSSLLAGAGADFLFFSKTINAGVALQRQI